MIARVSQYLRTRRERLTLGRALLAGVGWGFVTGTVLWLLSGSFWLGLALVILGLPYGFFVWIWVQRKNRSA